MKKIAGIVPAGILDQHVAVLGKTRSGKSSVMRQIVEALLDAGKPVCIVDPKGDWWGIKLAKDGRSPGYPVVMFGNGPHANVPINEHSGAIVGELWATGNRSCLIDLGGWTVVARTQFWIDFAAAVFKHTVGDRWLVIDEVHNFGPKGSLKGTEGRMATSLHWTNRLASEGLGKGVHLVFASQRPQKVHNDTLTSAETLVAMRVLHPSDRQANADWIAGNGDSAGKEVLATLSQLQRGEAWVWSPEIGFGPTRLQFPMFSTYDSFRSQSAEDTKRLKGWAEIDLDDVRAKLGKVVEEAKANDPKELKKQLVSTRAELAKAQQLAATAQQASPEKSPVRSTPALTDADRALIEKLTARLAELEGKLEKYQDAAKNALDDRLFSAFATFIEGGRDRAVAHAEEMKGLLEAASVKKLLEKLNGFAVAASAPLSKPAHIVRTNGQTPAPGPKPKAPRTVKPPTDGIAPIQQRILNAIAEMEMLGVPKPAREVVGFLCNYSNLRSPGFANNVSALRTAGMVDYPDGDSIILTASGKAAAQYPERPSTAKEVQARILALLAPISAKILEPLIEAYPEKMAREDVAARAGYTNLRSPGFANNISHLRTLGFVDYPDRESVIAKPVLFLEAR